MTLDETVNVNGYNPGGGNLDKSLYTATTALVYEDPETGEI